MCICVCGGGGGEGNGPGGGWLGVGEVIQVQQLVPVFCGLDCVWVFVCFVGGGVRVGVLVFVCVGGYIIVRIISRLTLTGSGPSRENPRGRGDGCLLEAQPQVHTHTLNK